MVEEVYCTHLLKPEAPLGSLTLVGWLGGVELGVAMLAAHWRQTGGRLAAVALVVEVVEVGVAMLAAHWRQIGGRLAAVAHVMVVD